MGVRIKQVISTGRANELAGSTVVYDVVITDMGRGSTADAGYQLFDKLGVTVIGFPSPSMPRLAGGIILTSPLNTGRLAAPTCREELFRMVLLAIEEAQPASPTPDPGRGEAPIQ